MVARTRRVVFIAIFVTTGFSINHAEVCPAADKKNWTYRLDHKNGPYYWGDLSPDCYGNQQAPINIDTSQVLRPKEPQILILKNFDIPIGKVLIENLGQYVEISPKDGVNRSLILDGKENPFLGFHFHFGNIAENGGSEHTLDGQRFPFEAHILFLTPEKVGLQVGIFFKFNDEVNPAIKNILSVKSEYKYEGDKFEGEIERKSRNPRKQGRIFLDDILDLNCPYYRYSGSYGFPPCKEPAPILQCKTYKYVKPAQWKRFLTITTVKKNEDIQKDCYMKNNNRPIQKSNNREVFG